MPNTESDNLMILRGKYITAIEQNKLAVAEIGRTTATIVSLFNIGGTTQENKIKSQLFAEHIKQLEDLTRTVSDEYKLFLDNQAEIDRLKPLTGF